MIYLSFEVKGFRVNLKPSFFVMCTFLVALGQAEQMCVIIFSVTAHEIAHILTARLWGLKTESVTLTPVGQTAAIKGMESLSLFRRLLVIIAGPMVNLVLFVVFQSPVNLGLFVLNLLPVYPLDGGRLLHYILGCCLGVLRANRVQSFLSRLTAMCIIGAGFVQMVLYGWNISLLCIGIYLYKINRREYINMTFAFYRSIMHRNDKKVVGVRGIVAGEAIKLKTIVYRLGWDYYTVVYVRDKNGVCNVSISEEELIAYVMQKNINHRLKEVVKDRSCN